MSFAARLMKFGMAAVAALSLAGCGLGFTKTATLPPAPQTSEEAAALAPIYVIGPGDTLEIHVWRSDDLSTAVPVRPDGRISAPLVGEIMAAGKTPSDLAQILKEQFRTYVQNPEVTVMVKSFSSTFDQQIRVLGQAQQPVALPYQAGMTVLDVMVRVGGLTEYAAGNRAVLTRGKGTDRKSYKVRLDDLIKNGDITANVAVLPGDVLLIPESLF
ncbi:MAG: XrtA/PEP-CTERM system exopolysaccharide export protein [Pseudomonadota bacterium]